MVKFLGRFKFRAERVRGCLELIGQYRARILRIAQYSTPITLIASILAVLKLYDISAWYFLIVIAFLVFVGAIDSHAIKGEIDWMNRNNKEWQQFRKEWDEYKNSI